MVKVILASGNQGKCAELSASLPASFQLVTQGEMGIESIPETGATFIENALLKARHAATVSGLPALADDSGIMVKALDGRPGIHSARFAGPGATDAENLAKLLHELQGTSGDRAASFYCCLVFMRSQADQAPLVAEGWWHGVVLDKPRGAGGFGYDPLFLPDGMESSAAELDAEVKQRHSHRGQALRLLAAKLAAL
ncbi:MAG: RdgB/HAM1 family non-canonical purine NTP pyrophosphatase [Pseudomonadales bacterium]